MSGKKIKIHFIGQFYLFLLLICTPLLLSAQSETFYFQQLLPSDGLLTQSSNKYIFKDSKDFVWIGSENGLNQFDSRHIKHYLPNNRSCSILGTNIQSNFFEDSSGNIWFSTYQAIHFYDRNEECFYPHYLQKGDLEIKEDYQLLYLDTLNNNLWVRSKDDLYLYSFTEKVKKGTTRFLGKIRKNTACQIIKLNNGSGFYLLEPFGENLRIKKFRDSVEIKNKHFPKEFELSAFIKTLYFDEENRLWIATNNGLFLLKIGTEFNKTITGPFNNFNEKKIKNITAVSSIEKNELIIGTKEDGLYLFHTDSLYFQSQVFIQNEEKIEPFLKTVHQLYCDSDFNLWISTRGQGVFYTNLKKKKFDAYHQNNLGSPEEKNNIRAMTEDSFSRIWLLTRDGIVVISKEGETIPELDTQLPNAEPYYIYCDSADRIWVGTQVGLYVLLPPLYSLKKVPPEKSQKMQIIPFIQELKKGKMLFASGMKGILEIDQTSNEHTDFILKKSPLLSDSVGYTQIYQDQKDRIYFCRNLKSIIVRDESFAYLGEDLLDANVTGFLEDRNNKTLWIATSRGLYSSDLSDSFSIKKDTILPFRTLNSILQDSLGRLWISTNREIVQYLPDSLKWTTYNLSDGLQSIEFNFWSSLKLSNGNFAFGGINGINIFNPYEIESIKTKAKPVITDIKINGEASKYTLQCDYAKVQNISEIKKLTFKHWENNLTFDFAALEYSDPSANQFAYKLEGINDTFVNIGTRNTVQFAALSYGNYTLLVDATNSDGAWSGNPHKLEIRIKPPWYFSIYAIIFYILATIGIIYAYYRYRIAQIRKEVHYKQMIAETETAVLRLQMNPHFIFNSMNSINSYILQKDIDTASDYLGRFARLMRMILNFAAKPLIEVTDETELLTLYLQTESMRFDERFDFSINYEDGFDPDEFLIPPMILQPFVENSILHAFFGKKEKGLITIRFWEKENSLFCSIEDNGIGRQASFQQNKTAKTHESKALAITKRRMELLEQKNGIVSSIKFIDLYDKNNKPIGTKVFLCFPIF